MRVVQPRRVEKGKFQPRLPHGCVEDDSMCAVAALRPLCQAKPTLPGWIPFLFACSGLHTSLFLVSTLA